MIPFHKYQGAGNDFIILDQRQEQYIRPKDKTKIAQWCDRRFGIGADGLITLENDPKLDFAMRYYNADGGESSLCGNGGRCIVAFAKRQGIIEETCRFMAVDGEHKAEIYENGQVALEMHDVNELERIGESYYLDTGSPHYVSMVPDAFDLDVQKEGRKVRYNQRFKEKGTNVNFISLLRGEERGEPALSTAEGRGEPNNEASLQTHTSHPTPTPNLGIRISTYERGVEDETLACGTGVTAAALVYHMEQNKGESGSFEIPVKAKGGNLFVRFQLNEKGHFSDIWLIGPAQHVFSGQME